MQPKLRNEAECICCEIVILTAIKKQGLSKLILKYGLVERIVLGDAKVWILFSSRENNSIQV